MQIKPGRKIPKNYRNITGKLSTEKSEGLISFESKLERDFYMLFEFNSSILYIKEQPVTLTCDITGVSYSPDFELLIKSEDCTRSILGEIKYKTDLRAKWDSLRPKFELAINYCKNEKNKTFKIFTDGCAEISNKNYLFNTHFLLNFKNFDQPNYELLRQNYIKNITLEKLLERCTDEELMKMRLMNTIWFLVRRGVIEVNLYKKLSLLTKIINFHSHTEMSELLLVREIYSMGGEL